MFLWLAPQKQYAFFLRLTPQKRKLMFCGWRHKNSMLFFAADAVKKKINVLWLAPQKEYAFFCGWRHKKN